MNESLITMLREKHAGAFEGWDEFEVSFVGRQRKGGQPEILVCLFNESTRGEVVDLHACFVVTSDKTGADVVRVGKTELYAEWAEAYVPGGAKS